MGNKIFDRIFIGFLILFAIIFIFGLISLGTNISKDRAKLLDAREYCSKQSKLDCNYEKCMYTNFKSSFNTQDYERCLNLMLLEKEANIK